MSTDAWLSVRDGQTPTRLRVAGVGDTMVRQLNSLAGRGLLAMFDVDRQLFCHRLVRTGGGLARQGVSRRYTIMALLGLRELELAGGDMPLDATAIYKAFVRDDSWIQCAGDLGLLIWLTAAFAADDLEASFPRAVLETALNVYPDVREGRTMELAWFLTGLAQAALALPGATRALTDTAVETYQRLEENQGEHGLFSHMHARKSVVGLLRGRIGSFADQIYPIFAMAKCALAFHMEEALSSARACAKALCRTQGELGQWWWLYESRSGRVSSRYPVYSVHQHGMAPMGLVALEEATGESFREPIYKGLQWIYGANELQTDMRDLSQNVIWRCIVSKNKRTKYRDVVLSLLGSKRDEAPVGALQIVFEERPYELGWLLYALARISMARNERVPSDQ